LSTEVVNKNARETWGVNSKFVVDYHEIWAGENEEIFQEKVNFPQSPKFFRK